MPHAPASLPPGAMHVPVPPDERHEFGALQVCAPELGPLVIKQQGSFASPHATHPLDVQRLPALQVSALQQSWPTLPQVEDEPESLPVVPPSRDEEPLSREDLPPSPSLEVPPSSSTPPPSAPLSVPTREDDESENEGAEDGGLHIREIRTRSAESPSMAFTG